jgi:MFS family permease
MNAYLIAFGGLLLLAGRLGDLIGRRRVFLSGLALFAAASLACGLSGSPQVLIAARFGQGAGGAMIAAVSLGMIVALYTEPRERAGAIGAYSFVGAAGASAGLVLGGVLPQAAGWRWVFFVNLPVAVLAVALAGRVLDPDRGAGLRAGADVPGALLVTSGLMLGVYALVGTAQYGWLTVRTLALATVAVVLLALFTARQARAARPLLPLRILTARSVAGANLAQFLVIAAAFGFQVIINLYMQRVHGYGAARSGLGLLPTAVVIGTVSLGFSARLTARFGARVVLLAGLTLIVAALAIVTGVPAGGGYAEHLLPALLVFGAGGGLTLPALATLGMSAATAEDAGLVSGLFNTSQQAGAAVGVALLSTLAAARTSHLLRAGQSSAAALNGGYHLAFAVGAGLAGAALVLALTMLTSHVPPPVPTELLRDELPASREVVPPQPPGTG